MSLAGTHVGVLGGGVAGLTFALCCARRGARVTVAEQADELGEVGAGLQISANAVRVFHALNLYPEREIPLNQPEKLHIYDMHRDFRLMTTRQNGPGRLPYLQLHRADLIGWLETQVRAAGVTVHLGRAATAGPGRMQVGTDRIACDHVAVASGVHTPDRAGPEPRFTGQVAWRALVPGTAAPEFAQGDTHVFVAPGRHLVVYPLRAGALVNTVAVEDGQSWDQEGWNHAGDPADLRARFAPSCDRVTDLLAQVDSARRWALRTHPQVAMLGRGGLPLIGDAAQAMLPFMAQGACMAIEDAWSLAATLDAGQPLDRWARVRAGRRERVGAVAVANGRLFHEGRAAILPFHRAGMWALGRIWPGLSQARTRFVYDHDVTAEFP